MIGQTISHYRITEKLGEGGMGVVYKAEDTKLDRPVALKFLAPHLLRDEEGRKRFKREAKAAAKLDHPNICTVYEIDEATGRTFIAMAFLEGRPLSQKIAEGPLKLTEALSIAIQMAEGLEAAHEKGITHRDIKPDNVMLLEGSRGLVKLMDFGLAQLAGSSKFTREGTTLGTVSYMSPEQAEGAETDRRTDVWSLGVVLYEMAAGRQPFRGDFDRAVVYSIMNEPAEPLTAIRTGVPKELERVVNKCLAKKPEQRYQHADELLVDLQALRHELEPHTSQVAAKPAAAKRTSPWLFGAAAVALLGAVGLTWLVTDSYGPETNAPPQYTLTQITRDSGYTGEPALSPDGRLLAYASDRSGDGNLDIWVQQLGGGEPLRLTTDEADDQSPSFSPDGNRIVFRSGRDDGGVYIVPALGGSQRRIAGVGNRLHNAGFNPRFSPDGDWVSYSVTEFNTANQVFNRAYIAPASGGTPHRLEINLAFAIPAAWSPDGKRLLVVGSVEPLEVGRAADFDWWLVPVEGGEAARLGARERLVAAGLLPFEGLGGDAGPWPTAWLPGENWVLFHGQMSEGDTLNLWRIRILPHEGRMLGEPQRLTAGTGEVSASASRDGRIAFVSATVDWDIWSLPLDANRAEARGELQRVVSGLGADLYPSISADGRRLVYMSDRSGNRDIWLRDLETGKDTQITVGPAEEIRGVISPDGTRVAFGRREQGRSKVYLAEIGRGAEQLLLEDIGSHVDWTPDGKKILYYTSSPIRWKTVEVETGEQRDLGLEHSQSPVHSVRFSPDQKWVAFKLQGFPGIPLFISRLIGGVAQDESQWVSLGDALAGANWWSPDGNTLYFLSGRDAFICIWAQPLDPTTKKPTGPPRALQHFHGRLRIRPNAPTRFGYGMTADKHYLPLGETKGNIWLAEPAGQ